MNCGVIDPFPTTFLPGKWPELEWASPQHKAGLMHSHQPLGPCLIYTGLEFSYSYGIIAFIFSHCLYFNTFSVLCWIHSNPEVILFDHFLYFCAVSNKVTLRCLCGLRRLRLLLNVSRVGKGEKQLSSYFTPSIMTASFPDHVFLFFYSHTSQPMSSHLRSPACKLHRSVSPNDAYRQWCVFSSSWHSKYKWWIIYNGFQAKVNAFVIEKD